MPGEVHHIHLSGPPRRLAAIVAGDISGYSRLMGIDEEGTHARVIRHQRELIEPTIAENHGRLIKTTGDGFIAIFDSPVEAVRCGIVIQQSMVGQNASVPRDRQILYRIGVNLGDVIIEPNDVYGDGVNIAVRLEGIASPGEVYISGGIYEQIKNKLVCGYQPLGDRQVKNITDPVKVYRVLPDPASLTRARRLRESVMLIVFGLLLAYLIAGASVWYFWTQRSKQMEVEAPVLKQAQTEVPEATPQPVAPTASGSPQSKPVVVPQAKPRSEPEAKPPDAPPSVREPDMKSLPAGTFSMGSNDDASERPVHQVRIKPFAIGIFPVTVREWNQCVAAKACTLVPIGDDDAPVTNVSWNDAQQFASWLSRATGKEYRLPSEAEWEYAARAGTQTKYWWGDQIQAGMADCKNCNVTSNASQPMKVGRFNPNAFGLYDMGGSVDQWVGDCWHKNYLGAPVDGSYWIEGDCPYHVIRSGSWKNDASYVRPASRDYYDTNVRYPTHGLRLARSL